MKIYNFDAKQFNPFEGLHTQMKEKLFILCTSSELLDLQPYFAFDKSTVIDCLNFDEVIRFSSFAGYDFISFIYFWLDEDIKLHEINLYVGASYLILVVPESIGCQGLEKILQTLLERTVSHSDTGDVINKTYYNIFDLFINDFSETLESIEDRINDIESGLHAGARPEQFKQIAAIKQATYVAKKQIRPLIYIGDQFIMNENKIILDKNMRYFRNIDVRLNKLHDFCASLQEYANQALNSYDSKITAQTNDIVNKLTALTIIIGPLTVVTGIYGMNFHMMPELSWKYGYPFALGLMLCITIVIYSILKIKKWL